MDKVQNKFMKYLLFSVALPFTGQETETLSCDAFSQA
jgi:hypothetical protein